MSESLGKPLLNNLKIIVGGESLDSKNSINVLNPYDESVLTKVPSASIDQIKHALKLARDYSKDPLTEIQRAKILNNWADKIENNSSRIAKILTLENGKTITNSEVEVNRATKTIRTYAKAALEINLSAHNQINLITENKANNKLVLTEEGYTAPIFYQPVGVVTAYTPFNFPANTVVHKISAAIAAGNSIVLKPSEKTPITALELGRLFSELDAPSNILSVLTGHYSDFNKPFIQNQDIDFFTMTGNSDIGKRLYKTFALANPFKRSHFELGGNAAQIILEDFDIGQAAQLTTTAVYDHNGQRCTTPRKILVPEGKWAKEFLDISVELTRNWSLGNPMLRQTKIGPLIDRQGAEKVEHRVDNAINSGADLLIGGKRKQAFYEPTILNNITPDMKIFKEENFGPVMCVIPYKSIKEAIQIANIGNFGLQPAVITNDMAAGWQISRQLRAGCINIGNATTSDRSDTTPFGGLGQSGIGKEGGLAGIKEMCTEIPYKFYI